MLTYINDPNLIYILFLVGIYGLFFELYNPGLLFPGITGVACLLLALYAFQSFPINYYGLALLTLGIALMVVEVLVNSYGIIGLLGVLAFVLGSIFLIEPGQTHLAIPWEIIALMALVSSIFFFIVINLSVRSIKQAQVMGSETLIGKIAEVLTSKDDTYQVHIFGEIWNAQSNKILHPGDKVQILSVNGMLLTVEPIEELSSKESQKEI